MWVITIQDIDWLLECDNCVQIQFYYKLWEAFRKYAKIIANLGQIIMTELMSVLKLFT